MEVGRKQPGNVGEHPTLNVVGITGKTTADRCDESVFI